MTQKPTQVVLYIYVRNRIYRAIEYKVLHPNIREDKKRRERTTTTGKATVFWHACYTLKRVSEPSASMRVTVLLFIQISLAKRMGLRRATSAMGAVLYDLMHRVCDCPSPNMPDGEKVNF